MVDYLYPSRVALDPTTGDLVVNGSLTVHDPSDTSGENPLSVTDASGLPLSAVNTTRQGLTGVFIADRPKVVLRSGAYAVPVEADLASGVVRSVNGYVPDSDGNVEFEVGSGGVDDEGLAALIATPASATSQALTSLYGPGILFLDLDEPVPAGTPDGTIIFRNAGGNVGPVEPVIYFHDDFERTVAAGGLGDPSGGGAYSLLDIPSDWSVGNGAATWKAPGAGGRGGFFRSSSYSQENVEMVGVVSQESGDVGNRVVSIAPRRPLGTNVQYAANITLRGPNASRPLQVDLALQRDVSEGDLASATGGVVTTGALGDKVHFRVRVTQVDASTTRVQARLWLDGTDEPTTWQKDATDTTANLQGAGSMAVLVRQNGPETVGSEVRIHEITVRSVTDG